MNDFETVRIACVDGPGALRTLIQTQGLPLATRFALRGPHASFLHAVLSAVVLDHASLDVLDVLEEQWPGLQVHDTQNGLTELIQLEASMRRGGADLAPDSDLRASIRATVRDVMLRMPASFDINAYAHYFDVMGYHQTTLPIVAINNRAYYTYEAFNCRDALNQLVTYNENFYEGLPIISPRVPQVLQEVVINLMPAASHHSLTVFRATILEHYERIHAPGYRRQSDENEYSRLGVIFINIAAVESELLIRRLLLFLCIFKTVFGRENGLLRIVHVETEGLSCEVFHLIASFM